MEVLTTQESPTKSVDDSISPEPQDLFFKYILIGNSGILFNWTFWFRSAVGKTSILTSFIKRKFIPNYKVTVGAEFGSRTIKIDDDTRIKIQVWDTVKKILRK